MINEDRRKFISMIGILGTVPLTSCALFKVYIVPALVGATLQELIKYAKENFHTYYSSGDVIQKSGVPDSVSYSPIKHMPDKLKESFQDFSTSDLYITPVSLHTKGFSRYIQLADRLGGWSLASGGKYNQEVYRIHGKWLQWLLEDDNCNLRLDGNTLFESCGIDDCPVHMSRQKFIDANDKIVWLQWTSDLEDVSDYWKKKHKESHTSVWKGCDIPSKSTKGKREVEFCPVDPEAN